MPEKKKAKNKGAGHEKKARGDMYLERVFPRLDEIRSLAAGGVPDSGIADKIGISRQTLANYRKKYDALDAAMSRGRDAVVKNVRAAIFKRALGYTVEETEEKTSIDKGHETKTVVRHIPPDIKACEILLRMYDDDFVDRAADRRSGDGDGGGIKIELTEKTNDAEDFAG